MRKLTTLLAAACAFGLAPFSEIMRSKEFDAIPKVLETPKDEDLKEDVENLRVLTGLLEKGRNSRIQEAKKSGVQELQEVRRDSR